MPQLILILVLAAAYGLAALRLVRRGRRLSRWRTAAFAAGIAVLLAALLSPIDRIGEERLFSVHMVQHLMIGDIAPLLVVLGLDGPLLRPLLSLRAVQRLRGLAHPLVALPLWAVNLCVWHLPVLYDAALEHDGVHALQHFLFFTCGALVWAALIEPLPGPAWFTAAWKLPYALGMWLVPLVLSQVFLWSNHVYYVRYHSVTDQRAGGGVMLVEGSFVMIGVLAWLLLRVFRESEARQRLLDAGVDIASATRAARYGRA
jgi:cytochrome c oxidase assembly factor CtaG